MAVGCRGLGLGSSLASLWQEGVDVTSEEVTENGGSRRCADPAQFSSLSLSCLLWGMVMDREAWQL